jgi:hypothetical protein
MEERTGMKALSGVNNKGLAAASSSGWTWTPK